MASRIPAFHEEEALIWGLLFAERTPGLGPHDAFTEYNDDDLYWRPLQPISAAARLIASGKSLVGGRLIPPEALSTIAVLAELQRSHVLDNELIDGIPYEQYLVAELFPRHFEDPSAMFPAVTARIVHHYAQQRRDALAARIAQPTSVKGFVDV